MPDAKSEMERLLGTEVHKRRTPLWIWAIALVALAAGGTWYFSPFGSDAARTEYESQVAEMGVLTVTVSATGTIEPTNQVEVSSELSGAMAEVLVDDNDEVAVGQVLARLDTTKLTAQLEVQKAMLIAAEARVAQAQSSLDQAAETYDATEQLEERGVSSHRAFVSARTAYDNAVAALQIADADRNLADAQLDMTQADLDKAVLHSPIRGIVLLRDVDPGQIVAASLSAPVLFTLAEDLSQMELQVDVDEADIGRISVGDRAAFTVEAYDEREFPAEITKIRFAPETVEGVVTYKAVLSIDNSGLLLRPGMTATSEITVADYEKVLLVPNAALRFAPPQVVEETEDDGGGGLLGMLIPDGSNDGRGAVDRNTVWRLQDGTAREIAVETGDSDGRFTIVSGGALEPGDLVVTDQTMGR
ncbi:MAG TPA: efflux RND transporter periplasmic adaptor subunit [Rhodobacteraceae bacterium]|nr:efflux RND transporter periplasmic adaptor subunit [Paracoccaceae bacterium]